MYVGTLNGLAVYESEHAVTSETIQTRKLKRKKKNRRWVKKFKKRYSKTVYTPCSIKIGNRLIIHPLVLNEIKYKLRHEQPQSIYPRGRGYWYGRPVW